MTVDRLLAVAVVLLLVTSGASAHSAATAEVAEPQRSVPGSVSSGVVSIVPMQDLPGYRAAAGGAEAMPQQQGTRQFTQADTPENLRALFEFIHDLIFVKNDLKSAAPIWESLVPDRSRLLKGLKSDVSPEIVRKLLAMHESFRQTTPAAAEAELREIARPEAKLVRVNGGTPEQLKDSPRINANFPGGAIASAEFLRPGMTFYEVSYAGSGTYHLLYWDGRQWTMMGPIWRALE